MVAVDKHEEIVEQTSRLGTLLISKGLLTDQQLQRALKLQAIEGGPLGDILVRSNIITRYQLHCALNEQHKLRAAIAALMTVGALALPEVAEADTTGSVTLQGFISPTVEIEAVAPTAAQAAPLTEIHGQGQFPRFVVNSTRDWSGYEVAVTDAGEQVDDNTKGNRLAVTVTVN